MKKIYSNVIKSLKNVKNKLLQNKKILLFILLVIIVIILGIIMIANKEDIGNTSGNLNNSGFSVQKSGWVYYLGLKNSNSDGIYKAKLNGDKVEKVNSDFGLYLNKSGNYLYYLDRTLDSYNIVKIKTSGKNQNKETIVEDVDANKISIVNNWIYYFKDSEFYRVKTNGKNKQILSNRLMNNYEVIGKWIYFSYTNNGKSIIAKMKINGENFTKIDDDASNLFYIKNNNIYYIYKNQEGSYELYKVKTNGKDKEKKADLTGEIQLDSINFDGNSLYYVKKDENDIINIYNIKLNGDGEREIVEIKDYNTIINVHDGWVYYTDRNENGDSQMYKIRINGKDKQSL